MRKTRVTTVTRTLALVALALAAALPAAAADAPTGLRADLLADVASVEGKILGLAEAIPADKYGWRPGEGVRTVSEAAMHVAGANFFFPSLLGMKLALPEGVNPRELEKITEKAKVADTLKASYGNLRQMIEGVSDAQLAEQIDFFGQKMTKAGFLHAVVSHSHEHLGQLIAYARSMGVKPPWSE